MPLYWDRLLADTGDLEAEEFGVYMRLMGRQWSKGSIPADITVQSRLGRVSVRRMKKILIMIGARLQSHPTIADAVYSPFMEKVREDSRKRSVSLTEQRRNAANKRWGNDADAMRSHSGSSADESACGSNAFLVPIPLVPNGTGDGAPEQPRLPSGEPSDLAAWQILDAAWESVSAEHELAVKRKDWRSHNKRAAKALADNGKTPEQVTAMLALAYTHPEGKRFYGGITTLAKLTEHWPKLAALEQDDEAEIRKAIMRGDYLPIC